MFSRRVELRARERARIRGERRVAERQDDRDPPLAVRVGHRDRPGTHARDLDFAVPALDRLEGPQTRLPRPRSATRECDRSDEAAHERQSVAALVPACLRLAAVGRFDGKRALVLGVANKRSIAWAIARRLADEGAELAFTFQGERIESNVRELAASGRLRARHGLRRALRRRHRPRLRARSARRSDGELDLLVHSVAFAAAEDLEGRFTDTPRDRFWMAVDISAYSLVAAARAAEPLMAAAAAARSSR